MSEDSENAQSLSKPALLPPTDALNSSETAPSTHFSTHSTGLHRPFRFFHPTRAQFSPRLPEQILDVKTSDFDAASHWSSRASRKNRYTPDVVHVRHHPLDSENVPSEVVLVEQRLRHPTSKIKVHLTWDISFWVAVLFVIGSTVWVSRNIISIDFKNPTLSASAHQTEFLGREWFLSSFAFNGTKRGTPYCCIMVGFCRRIFVRGWELSYVGRVSQYWA